MSDDYDDEDEPGGLWDPDAFAPPPPPARPALHIVATPASAHELDRRADAPCASEDADPHTLVRLEQFRTASDGRVRRRSTATSPTLRWTAAAGILASVAAAIAITYGTLRSPERSDRPAPTAPAAAILAVDSEHAAATREAASSDSQVGKVRRPRPHTTKHFENKRHSGNASQNRSAPHTHHTSTAASSNAATSTPTVVTRTATPTTHRQTPTATSEFGFEG